eukprot:Rmarinus@m.26201
MKRLSGRILTIAWAVGCYWFISLTMVFLNKELLTNPSFSIGAPIFLVFMQCGITVVCSLFSFLQNASIHVFEKTTCFRILPLSLVFTASILFKMYCLKEVEVTFYYIAGSGTLVFNVVFSYLILKTRTSPLCIVCCCLVIVGFFLGVEEEINLSMRGVSYGLLFSAFDALRSVMIKKALPTVYSSELLLNFYNNLNACLILVPAVLFSGELSRVIESPSTLAPAFWGGTLVSGVCGFAMGFVTIQQINTTSPLTHNISTTSKACAQTVLAYFFYQNKVTAGGWVSIFVVLLGSLGYAFARYRELDRELNKVGQVDTEATASSSVTSTAVRGRLVFVGDEPTNSDI